MKKIKIRLIEWLIDRRPFYRLGRRLCERFGHPSGAWYYTSASEPDMHCKSCGLDLG